MIKCFLKCYKIWIGKESINNSKGIKCMYSNFEKCIINPIMLITSTIKKDIKVEFYIKRITNK